jgi:hypothetical protein
MENADRTACINRSSTNTNSKRKTETLVPEKYDGFIFLSPIFLSAIDDSSESAD